MGLAIMGITLDYPTCLSHLSAAKLYGIGISAKSFISTALPVTLFLYQKLDYLFCVVWLQVEDLVNKREAVVKELNKLKHENKNPRPGSVMQPQWAAQGVGILWQPWATRRGSRSLKTLWRPFKSRILWVVKRLFVIYLASVVFDWFSVFLTHLIVFWFCGCCYYFLFIQWVY